MWPTKLTSKVLRTLSLTLLSQSILLSMGIALAADLKAPVDLSSARVLPKGVRNARYKVLLISGNNKFNNAGNTEILADPFFKTLNWRDITDPKVDTTAKGSLEGYLRANGYDLDELVGKTTGALSVSASAHVPVLAYGFTPKFTMALAVPIVQYKFNVQTGFLASENVDKLMADLERDGKIFDRNDAAEKLRDPISTKLRDFGYKPLKSESGTKIGDIKLVSKYLLIEKDNFFFTLQGEATLPTGKRPDINKVVDVSPGDGQWDVGAGVVAEWLPTDRLTLTGSLIHTVQIADTTAKRIPYQVDSSISNNIDEKVKRDLGDFLSSQLGAKYEVLKGFNVNSGLGFQIKDKDRYSGQAYNSRRYDWMEAKTRQRMLTGQVGLGYSTLKLFREGAFKVPLEANINHSFVMSGKNVAKDPTTALELVMFF